VLYKERITGVDWGHTGNGSFHPIESAGTPSSLCAYLGGCTKEVIREHYDHGITHPQGYLTSQIFGNTEKFGSTRRPRPRFNNCEHWKMSTLAYPYGGVLKQGGRNAAGLAQGMRLAPSSYVVDPVQNHPLVDISAAQRAAWHEMQEEFAGNVSLINFIYELKDFKDMQKFLFKRPLSALSSKIRELWGAIRKGKINLDPTKPAAELHLLNSFAIQPLIADLFAIKEQLDEMVRQLQEEFKLSGMTGNTRHYSETWVHQNTAVQAYRSYYSVGWHYSTKFVATLDYSFDYRMRSFNDAVATYWGAKLTAEAIWNAIPFSFLVDYVFTIGKSIARMTHDDNVHTNIHQYCESLLSCRSYGTHIDPGVMPSPIIVNNQFVTGVTLVAGTKASYYTRTVCVPNKGTSLPRVKMPNLSQGVNALALLRCAL